MALDAIGLGSIADLASTIIDKIWPDPAKAAEARAALLAAQNAGALKDIDQQFQLQLEQIKVDAAEAAQPGLHFRDGAGWVAVAGFALTVLKSPIEWGCNLAGHPVTLPPVDSMTIEATLGGLLGLGGMHAWQTVKTQ